MMSEDGQRLAEALAARDRSRRELVNPTKPRSAGASKRRKKTRAQKRARRANRG